MQCLSPTRMNKSHEVGLFGNELRFGIPIYGFFRVHIHDYVLPNSIKVRTRVNDIL